MGLVNRLTVEVLKAGVRHIRQKAIFDVVAVVHEVDQILRLKDDWFKILHSHLLTLLSTRIRISDISVVCSGSYVIVEKIISPDGTFGDLFKTTTSFKLPDEKFNVTTKYFSVASLEIIKEMSTISADFDPKNTTTYKMGQHYIRTWTPVNFVKGPSGDIPLMYTEYIQMATDGDCAISSKLIISDAVFFVWLSDYLGNLANSAIYVMETQTNLLLLTSSQESPFRKSTEGEYERISAKESDDPRIRLSAKHIHDVQYPIHYESEDGQTYLNIDRITGPNLDWTVVLVLPEDDFFPTVEVSLTTGLVTLGFLLLTAMCSYVGATVISTPVKQLNIKMQNLADGNWVDHKPLKFQFVKEFAKMEEAFSKMQSSLVDYTTRLDTLVKQRTEQLERALEAADRANKAKSNFLANMSHEIRTPMHGIISMVNFMLETQLTTEQRDWCMDIHSSTMALLQVLNDILDLSKVEAGKMLLECIEFDLLVLMEEMISVYYSAVMENRKKYVDLLLQFDPQLPRKVYGDPTRVRQILSNLLSNAAKFTDLGFILVKVKSSKHNPPLGFKLPGAADFVNIDLVGLEIEVIDTGIGMSEEQSKGMFTQYTQADVSTARKYGGTGLGLCIIKNLVEMLGGSISVESKLREGSKFYLSFFLGVRQGSVSTSTTPESIGIHVNKKGLMITSTKELFETTISPLKEIIKTWEMANSIDQANRYLESNVVTVVMVDTPFLPKIREGQLRLGSGRYSRLILMKDGRTSQSEIPDCITGVLSKPFRPSSIQQTFLGLLGQAKFRRSVSPESGQPHYEELMLKVLLVEDNLVNQKVASLLLQKMKCQVTLSSNGLDAVNKVKASLRAEGGYSNFDIVLMDVMMPVMDGITATLQIREWEAEQNIARSLPIIALTAQAMVEDKDKCLEAGMDGYLSKPLDKERLAYYLQKLTKRSLGYTLKSSASYIVQ